MPRSRVLLLGYEAICSQAGEVVWLLTTASRPRIHLHTRGRHHPPQLVLHVGDAECVVDHAVRVLADARVIDVELSPHDFEGVGTLQLRHGADIWRWPVRFVVGLSNSAAQDRFGNSPPDTSSPDWSKWCADQSDGVERMWAHVLRARRAQADGRHDLAATARRRAVGEALALGVPAWAARWLRATAYHHLNQTPSAVDAAQHAMDEAERHTLAEDADGRINTDYMLGLVAGARGEPLTAGAFIAGARDRAWRWGASPAFVNSIEAGLATIVGEGGNAPETLTGDATAAQLINWAWGRIEQAARRDAPAMLDEVDGQLARTLAPETELRDPDLRARVHTNRAWVGLLQGRLTDAHAHLQAARGVIRPSPGTDRLADEFDLLNAQLALTLGDALSAQEALERIVSGGSPGATIDPLDLGAHHIMGKTLVALGEFDRAVEYFSATLTALSDMAKQVSTRQREQVLRERTPYLDPVELVDDTAVALRALGRSRDVFAVRNDALAIRRTPVVSPADVRHMSHDDREAWSALEQRWRRLKAEADRARRARRLGPEARREVLAHTGRELRRTWERLAQISARIFSVPRVPVGLNPIRNALEEDEALLMEWRCADGTLERWWVRHDAHHVERASPRFTAIDFHLSGVAHLYVIPGPDTPAWAALPLATVDGEPVAAQVGISFLPSATDLMRRSSRGSGAPLIIVDPRQDLPHADADGPWLTSHLPDARLLCGSEAIGEAVRQGLGSANFFHFSGHGEPAAGTEDGAELLLANGETLRAEEIILGGLGPDRAVLNGCDTGSEFAGYGLSLPMALWAAGTRQILVTVRPVPDEAASRFIRLFYDAGGVEDASKALACATRTAWADGLEVWSAYRLIGLRSRRP